MAWGLLKNNTGIGINLILLEDNGNIYGKWIQVENTNSGLSNFSRIEPFAFEINELENEVKLFNVMNTYNSKVEPLNIKKILEKYIINEI